MICFRLRINRRDCTEDPCADNYCYSFHGVLLPNVEPYWHGEIEGFTGHVGRGRREWLRTLHRVDRFLIKRRNPRRANDAARQNSPSTIEREREFGRAGLVAGARRSGIALMTFNLQRNLAVPGGDLRRRWPWPWRRGGLRD